MSDNNPFAEPSPSAQSASGKSAAPVRIAVIVLALLALLFFGLWISARSGGREVSSLQDKLSETLTNLAVAQSENQTNQD